MRDVFRKRLACGNTNLFFYQIASVNLFGDRVFNLDACVHFHEVEMAVLVDKELDCARVLVADRFGQFHRSVSHLLAKSWRHQR